MRGDAGLLKRVLEVCGSDWGARTASKVDPPMTEVISYAIGYAQNIEIYDLLGHVLNVQTILDTAINNVDRGERESKEFCLQVYSRLYKKPEKRIYHWSEARQDADVVSLKERYMYRLLRYVSTVREKKLVPVNTSSAIWRLVNAPLYECMAIKHDQRSLTFLALYGRDDVLTELRERSEAGPETAAGICPTREDLDLTMTFMDLGEVTLAEAEKHWSRDAMQRAVNRTLSTDMWKIKTADGYIAKFSSAVVVQASEEFDVDLGCSTQQRRLATRRDVLYGSQSS